MTKQAIRMIGATNQVGKSEVDLYNEGVSSLVVSRFPLI
jgi:hypothetical protein